MKHKHKTRDTVRLANALDMCDATHTAPLTMSRFFNQTPIYNTLTKERKEKTEQERLSRVNTLRRPPRASAVAVIFSIVREQNCCSLVDVTNGRAHQPHQSHWALIERYDQKQLDSAPKSMKKKRRRQPNGRNIVGEKNVQHFRGSQQAIIAVVVADSNVWRRPWKKKIAAT